MWINRCRSFTQTALCEADNDIMTLWCLVVLQANSACWWVRNVRFGEGVCKGSWHECRRTPAIYSVRQRVTLMSKKLPREQGVIATTVRWTLRLADSHFVILHILTIFWILGCLVKNDFFFCGHIFCQKIRRRDDQPGREKKGGLLTCCSWRTCDVERNINPLKTKCRLLSLKTQFVPRSKHFSSRL